ncbi:MAG: BTAD domain-containing putative transcriptional regulator [Myxococcota bacterium]
MPPLNAYLLGPPRFEHAGREVDPPSRKATALLAFLAVERRRSRDDVSTLLWGPGRLQNLRQELHVLRRLPGADEWLVTDRTHVTVHAESDVEKLRDAQSAGHDPSRWWRGEPCAELERVRAPAFVDWLEQLREELERVRVHAAVAAARKALRHDDDDGAWGIVVPLLEESPHDELVWRSAIEIRLRQGRTTEALELFELADRRFVLQGRAAWGAIVTQLRRSAERSTDTLSKSTLRVLRALCVSDRSPPVPVLGAVVGAPDLELAESLQQLRDGGWLGPDGEVSSGIREQIRDGLAPQTAQVLHGRLADALAASGAAPGRFAGHLEAAGRPSSAAYLDEARRSGSPAHLEHALRTATTPHARCAALAEGVRLMGRRGDAEAAQAWWRRLEDAAVRTQDPEGLRQTAVLGALLEGRAGHLVGAHARLDDAELLVGESDPALAAVRGALAFFAGRPEDARPQLAAGLATDDVDLRITAINALGALAGLAGEVDEAARLHREALTIARRERRLHLVTMLLNNLAATAQRRGDLSAALLRYGESARLADEIGDAQLEASIAFNEANVLIELGRLGRARDPTRRLLDTPLRQPRMRGLGCRVRADLERACGRFDEAAAWSARAVLAFEEAGDEAHALTSRFNEAQAKFRSAPSPRRRADLQDALVALERLERPDLVHAGRAELALCTTDVEALRGLVSDAPRTPREWAAAQRLALLEGRGLVDDVEPRLGEGGSWVGHYLDALAAGALAGTDPARAEGLREGVRRRITEGAEGLLTAQRAALDERVARWLGSPRLPW